MKRMLINATHHQDELRIALVNGQTVYDLAIESTRRKQTKSNIYKGVITRIEPSLEAAFVDYGGERHGFLPMKEIAPIYYHTQEKSSEAEDESNAETQTVTTTDANNEGYEVEYSVEPASEEQKSNETQTKPRSRRPQRPNIADVIKEGQEVLVQVEKEGRGTKGAALTTYITLAGAYLVLMPCSPKAGGISRRIEGEERTELKEKLAALTRPNDMGVIVRTAGLGKNVEELQWDLDILIRHWDAIKTAFVQTEPPALIFQESSIVIRTVRDYLRKDIEEVIIDQKDVYEETLHHIECIRPDLASRVKLYNSSTPLFTRFQIESQIESAYARQVALPSGGALVIDHTEALISIDINSAKATKGSDIEDTALNTNLEAADEIARQLRLRDLGGLVVIDFIDMHQSQNQREVEERIRRALETDRARIQIGRISRFGLLEMSRQRLRPALAEAMQTCPRCEGQGTIRGLSSLALSVLRIIEEQAIKENTAQVRVQLPVELATYLLNEKRHAVAGIEERQQVRVLILPNIHFEMPRYEVERIRLSDNDPKIKAQHSYDLVSKPEEAFTIEHDTKDMSHGKHEPIVKSIPLEKPTFTPSEEKKTTKKKSKGLLSRLFSALFGEDTKKKPAKKKTQHHRKSASGSRKPRNHQGNRRPRGSGQGGQRRRSGGGQQRRGGQGGNQRRGRPQGSRNHHQRANHSKDKGAKQPPSSE